MSEIVSALEIFVNEFFSECRQRIGIKKTYPVGIRLFTLMNLAMTLIAGSAHAGPRHRADPLPRSSIVALANQINLNNKLKIDLLSVQGLPRLTLSDFLANYILPGPNYDAGKVRRQMIADRYLSILFPAALELRASVIQPLTGDRIDSVANTSANFGKFVDAYDKGVAQARHMLLVLGIYHELQTQYVDQIGTSVLVKEALAVSLNKMLSGVAELETISLHRRYRGRHGFSQDFRNLAAEILAMVPNAIAKDLSLLKIDKQDLALLMTALKLAKQDREKMGGLELAFARATIHPFSWRARLGRFARPIVNGIYSANHEKRDRLQIARMDALATVFSNDLYSIGARCCPTEFGDSK